MSVKQLTAMWREEVVTECIAKWRAEASAIKERAHYPLPAHRRVRAEALRQCAEELEKSWTNFWTRD